MSRFGAGLGAFAGSLVGFYSGIAIVGHDPDEPDDVIRREKAANEPFVSFLGAVGGATIGAAIGAGSSKPKQVTAGVRALPSNMGGGFFP